DAVRACHRRQRAQRGVDARLLARRAIRRANAEVVDERRQMSLHERLIARDPGQTRLRIRHPADVAAERTVVVNACGASDKQTVAESKLLLPIKAKCVVSAAVRAWCSLGAGRADRREAR